MMGLIDLQKNMMPYFLKALFLCALFQFSFFAVSAQDDDVISIDSSLVVLNATIIDKAGKPASGLKREQFSVFEDGKEQQIAFFETQSEPFAAAILIDTSGSMEERISLARASAVNFLNGLRGEDQCAIYSFDSKVKLVQDFSASRDISEAIFDIKADGWTTLYDAIYKAGEELAKRSEKRRAIVVLSDGIDTKSGKSSDKALKKAIEANATIYTVDMSKIGDKNRQQSVVTLKEFADKSGGKFIGTEDIRSLSGAFKSIVDELSTQYTLGYQPANTAKDGKWREIELRIAKPGLTIRTRKGYNAPKK